jgi:hypothetical protein
MRFNFKTLIILPLLLVLGSWSNPSPLNPLLNYCAVYGNIFLTDKASKADFVVFIESQESFADLVVFKERSSAYANQTGKWCFVEDGRLADYYIYITKNISEADFSIAYTDTESFIGCNKK